MISFLFISCFCSTFLHTVHPVFGLTKNRYVQSEYRHPTLTMFPGKWLLEAKGNATKKEKKREGNNDKKVIKYSLLNCAVILQYHPTSSGITELQGTDTWITRRKIAETENNKFKACNMKYIHTWEFSLLNMAAPYKHGTWSILFRQCLHIYFILCRRLHGENPIGLEPAFPQLLMTHKQTYHHL